VVDAHAGQLGDTHRWAGRASLVSLLARLQTTPLGQSCVLTVAEEAAYARTANRMNHIWAHRSVIDRYLY
jgi:hypothetical protein